MNQVEHPVMRWIIAAGHSTPSFLFISALPNELNEEMKRVDGLCGPRECIEWNNCENLEWSLRNEKIWSIMEWKHSRGGASQPNNSLLFFIQPSNSQSEIWFGWWKEKKENCCLGGAGPGPLPNKRNSINQIKNKIILFFICWFHFFVGWAPHSPKEIKQFNQTN